MVLGSEVGDDLARVPEAHVAIDQERNGAGGIDRDVVGRTLLALGDVDRHQAQWNRRRVRKVQHRARVDVERMPVQHRHRDHLGRTRRRSISRRAPSERGARQLRALVERRRERKEVGVALAERRRLLEAVVPRTNQRVVFGRHRVIEHRRLRHDDRQHNVHHRDALANGSQRTISKVSPIDSNVNQ